MPRGRFTTMEKRRFAKSDLKARLCATSCMMSVRKWLQAPESVYVMRRSTGHAASRRTAAATHCCFIMFGGSGAPVYQYELRVGWGEGELAHCRGNISSKARCPQAPNFLACVSMTAAALYLVQGQGPKSLRISGCAFRIASRLSGEGVDSVRLSCLHAYGVCGGLGWPGGPRPLNPSNG